MTISTTSKIARYERMIGTLLGALEASAGNGDVVSYTTEDGRTVKRSRKAVHDEIDAIEVKLNRLRRQTQSTCVYARRSG